MSTATGFVYVAGGHHHWPGIGLWGFADVDHGTGRPLLCLLVDLGAGELDALVTVRLRLDDDPPTLVTDPTPDARRRLIAGVVDLLAALVSYPARTDADLVGIGKIKLPAPRRLSRLAAGDKVWLVGYPR